MGLPRMIVAGEYAYSEGMFSIGVHRFKVRERAEGSPKLFFIRTNPFLYCSSLYPTARADVFGFEVGRKWYGLQFKGSTVRIWLPRWIEQAKEQGQNNGARVERRERVQHNYPSLSPSRK